MKNKLHPATLDAECRAYASMTLEEKEAHLAKVRAAAKPETKSEIFKAAWELARKGAARFGGSSKQYFAEALKAVYANIRERKMAA